MQATELATLQEQWLCGIICPKAKPQERPGHCGRRRALIVVRPSDDGLPVIPVEQGDATMSQHSIVSVKEPLEQVIKQSYRNYDPDFVVQMRARAMLAMFKALALAARTKHQFERLHAALPDDCRLLREDFLLLKEMVENLLPEGATAEHALQDDAILHVLASIRGGMTLQEYYWYALQERIFSQRVTVGVVDYLSTRYIWYWGDAHAHRFAEVLYKAAWEGLEVHLRFAVHDETAIVVTIFLSTRTMTEPLTHKVRTTFSTNPACRLNTADHALLRMEYRIVDSALQKLLDRVEMDFPHDELGSTHPVRQYGFMVTDAFLVAVRERFATSGIMFGTITPLKRSAS